MRLKYDDWDELSSLLNGEHITTYDSLPALSAPSPPGLAAQDGLVGFGDSVLSLLARDENVIIVAASGNSEQEDACYPAAYPSVISVGAVDARGEHLDFSNYGTYLSVTAPGYAINAAWPGDRYAKISTPLGSRKFNATNISPGAIQTFSMPVRLSGLAKGEAIQVSSKITLGTRGQDDTPQNNQREDALYPK